jgi:uncharacterized phage protein gp47/JayE
MLDKTGFKRKRFADLFGEMEVKAKEVFGQQLNTTDKSFMGILLRIFAWFLARAWQTAEDVYQSGYIPTATGSSLSRLGPSVGIQRIQAKAATGSVTITGTNGYAVPSGFRIATSSGILYETLEPILLTGGNGTGELRAVAPGRSGNIAAAQATVIINPVPDVTAVLNGAMTGGREIETDAEFRDRFALSVAGGGAATVDAIRAALLRTTGIRAAAVIENYSHEEDAAGRPPKSFEAVVLGGDPADIGQTILSNKAAGIEPFGAETVTVIDIGGFTHTIRFSYAAPVMVHLRLTVSTTNSFPADGPAQLRTALIRYVGGEDADGTLYVGLNMGDDVVHSRLIAAAYGVSGVSDIQIEVSQDGNTWMVGNLAVAPNEAAQASFQRIEVLT